jgi:tetratricopeptide (TPR) repeat protein
MVARRIGGTWVTAVLTLAGAGSVAAQDPAHLHYQQPAGYEQSAPSGAVAPRLMNLGSHTFPVSNASADAQRFIDQGVRLVYGFNHAEAGRAFAEAARLSPDCAMAYWGQALVLGPNINAPMDPRDEPRALELARQAVAKKIHASPREQDYIDAVATRYTGRPEDRQQADRAYAAAMRTLHQKYPEDLDAAAMFAESLMDVRPWNYWTRDGRPYPGTDEIVSVLESILERQRDHPGALHYWIHVWEPTKTPERAEAEADRLLPLMPGAGHVVHMPAHIYLRVGRYNDVVTSNRMAVQADEDYITQCRAQGLYPLGYYPHNLHFIWIGATMSGQSQVAIEAARKAASVIPKEALADVPFLQAFLVVPYYALVRFGKWDEILALPAPDHDTLFTRGVWHYIRGAAFTAKNQLPQAETELAALQTIVGDPELPKVPATFSLNTADAILRIASEVVAGELAARKRDIDKALLHLDRAIRYEDALVYTEPPDWHYPVRQSLGAVLLQAGRPAEAETVYWDDLRRHPENGWSLFGLLQALKAQGKTEDASLVEQRFQKAWTHADVQLGASRF